MGKGKKTNKKSKRPVVGHDADLKVKDNGRGFTALGLVVAVLVALVAIFVARAHGSQTDASDASAAAPSKTNESEFLILPDVFGDLTAIDPIPYNLLPRTKFRNADPKSRPVPELPDGLFHNPQDIIPALHKAVGDANAVVSTLLVQRLLEPTKIMPGRLKDGSGGDNKVYARLLWKAAKAFYFATDSQLLDLRVAVLHKHFDLVFDKRGGGSGSSDNDKRRAVEMLGQALESRNDQDRGDRETAWRLYNGAVRLGLWGLPDQRPQHYFPFLEAGDPFPSADLYRGAVDLLEKEFEPIRNELILHKKFSGKMDIDREHLADGGKWLQADFLLHNQWDEDNIKHFPVTAGILRRIYNEYAKDLPDAVMQMSTMTAGTKVRPHCGSGNHKVRLHLALYIPKGVGIKIANDTDCWVNSKVLVVDDSYEHSVWNDSEEPRTVLIVDVWKAGISPEDKEKVMRHFARRDAGIS